MKIYASVKLNLVTVSLPHRDQTTFNKMFPVLTATGWPPRERLLIL